MSTKNTPKGTETRGQILGGGNKTTTSTSRPSLTSKPSPGKK